MILFFFRSFFASNPGMAMSQDGKRNVDALYMRTVHIRISMLLHLLLTTVDAVDIVVIVALLLLLHFDNKWH